MKFLAAILSCLILILSTGVGGMVIAPEEETGCCAQAAQTESACCCCGGDQARPCPPDTEQDHGARQSCCPFCISQTCPGFTVTCAVSVPSMLAVLHTGECMFIQHKYLSPSTDGIWQPPKTA